MVHAAGIRILLSRASAEASDSSQLASSAVTGHSLAMDDADVIVVGLGAMGSAVTLRLAQRGLRVIGIDRFRPPHDRGSTHGQTRITRLAIGEGE
jgi:phosphoglycerate dehydrogenase-like enzyme